MPLSITGPIVDAAAAWKLVGDSDFLNRQAGNPPLTYQIHPDAWGYPELKGEVLGPGPIRHHFAELDLYWVMGQRFRQIRDQQGPLLRRSYYEATLTPEGEGVRPTITVEMEPTYRWMSGVIRALSERGLHKWGQLLDSLPRPGQTAQEPVRRALSAGTAGVLRRWRERGAPEDLVEAVSRYYQQARLPELRELRPYALARRWGRDPRELLDELAAIEAEIVEEVEALCVALGEAA